MKWSVEELRRRKDTSLFNEALCRCSDTLCWDNLVIISEILKNVEWMVMRTKLMWEGCEIALSGCIHMMLWDTHTYSMEANHFCSSSYAHVENRQFLSNMSRNAKKMTEASFEDHFVFNLTDIWSIVCGKLSNRNQKMTPVEWYMPSSCDRYLYTQLYTMHVLLTHIMSASVYFTITIASGAPEYYPSLFHSLNLKVFSVTHFRVYLLDRKASSQRLNSAQQHHLNQRGEGAF